MKMFLKKNWFIGCLILASLFLAYDVYSQVAGNSNLIRRAAGIWAITDQTSGSPQTIEIYNFNDPTLANFERASVGWVGNIFTMTYGTSGTGNAGRVIQSATYSIAGTQLSGAHMVQGSVLTSSGAATLTFSNTAVFTGSTTYICNANDMTKLGTDVKVVPTSGTAVSFQLSSTANDSVGYQCNGN